MTNPRRAPIEQHQDAVGHLLERTGLRHSGLGSRPVLLVVDRGLKFPSAAFLEVRAELLATPATRPRREREGPKEILMTTASFPLHLKACVERILYPVSSANGTYAIFRSPRAPKRRGDPARNRK